ncbi:MAG: hypothetical protein AAF566_08735, partial [Pseudomonadota bacterium]
RRPPRIQAPNSISNIAMSDARQSHRHGFRQCEATLLQTATSHLRLDQPICVAGAPEQTSPKARLLRAFGSD